MKQKTKDEKHLTVHTHTPYTAIQFAVGAAKQPKRHNTKTQEDDDG
jgi:hypothetical protein